MTGQHDPTEELIEQSLTSHAAQAPSDGDLLENVHGRLQRRRRTGRSAGAILLAGAAVAAGIVGVNTLQNKPEDPPVTAVQSDEWRWESYKTVEVQVPAQWGYGSGVNDPWCLVDKLRPPGVSRPGPVRAIACGEGVVPLAYRTSSLTFGAGGRTAGVREYDHGWAEETRVVAGVTLTVFGNDETLRRRILGSARPIAGADGNGCTPTHPLATRPGATPPSTGGVSSIGTVESISVCRYSTEDAVAPLLSSSQITGNAARTLVDAIDAAPEGTGPNSPTLCSDQYGEEVLVLRVVGSDRDQEVLLRYSGCNHLGTDDGATRRRLTAPVVQPLLKGPHQPTSY
ncbi:MAG: hypothetical protein ACRDPR_01110, partial [Nocardioidaceae bacterium]